MAQRFTLRGLLARTLTALMLLAAAPHPAAAADGRWTALATPTFRNVGEDEGLRSADEPTAFAQDGEGFVWIGAQGALLRWDGYRFREYFADPRTVGALPDGYINALHTDPTGRLWVGTNIAGVVSYDRVHDRFTRYGLDAGLGRAFVAAIADDGRGGLWIGGERGLDHLDPKTGRVEHAAPSSDGRGLPPGTVAALLLDRDGALWVATQKGLFRRGRDGGFALQPLPTTDAGRVLSLFQDADRRIWIGTGAGAFMLAPDHPAELRAIRSGPSERLSASVTTIGAGAPGEVWLGTSGQGVVVVDAATLRTRRIQHVASVSASLGGDTIAKLFKDRSGLVWAATNRGLSLYNPAQDGVATLFGDASDAHGLADPDINSVGRTDDGHIWLGLGTKGVDILDPDRGLVGRLRPGRRVTDHALPPGSVDSIAAAPAGAVYLGTGQGLYRTDLAARTVASVAGEWDSGARIRSLLYHDGVLWIGANGLTGLVLGPDGLPTGRKASLQGALTNPHVFALSPGPDGSIWVGTHSGVNRVDRAFRVVERLEPDPNDPHALSAGGVTSLLTDGAGRLWIASTGSGIDILVGHDAHGRPRLRHLGTADGLPNASVDGLLQGPDGAIWASTDDGLARIDPRSFRIDSLQHAEGVRILNYWNGSAATTKQGELLFGGLGGLTVVDPKRLTPWTFSPPVVITEAAIGDGSTVTGGALARTASGVVDLRPEANRLKVEFAALDYWAPDRNRYAYRLQGHDHDWIATDPTRRSADYENLPPGRYTLRLRGSNHVGAWTTSSVDVPIFVAKAWWRTWTFSLAVVAVAIACVLALVQARTRYLRRRQRELERQVADRTRELSASHRELEKMAYCDALTGLPNRRMFTEDCRRLIAQARRHDRRFALLLIDLDRFKAINDTMGHDAGDALLKETAARLQSVIRATDHVARLGGDEFAILLGDADAVESVETVCRRLIEAFEPPTPFRDLMISTSPSVGVAIYADDGETEEGLYKTADLALYAAKRAGRNTWRRYEPAMAGAETPSPVA